MKKIEGQTLRRRRAIGGGIAGATAAAVILAGAIAPNIATAAPADKSEALGQILSSQLLGADLLAAASTAAGNPSAAGPDSNPLNVDALGLISIDLGGGLTLPLVSSPGGAGLLDLGQVGALHSYAASPTETKSTASAGAISEDGTIALDPESPGAYGPATVNLTDLLDQLGLSGVTDQIVDELSLKLGASASTATVDAGVTSSQYVLAGAEFNLSAPIVGDVAGLLTTALTGVGDTLDAAVGTGGVLDNVIKAVDLDLGAAPLLSVSVGGGTIAIDGIDAALTAATNTLITEPLADPNGIVSIDLANGTVKIDLEKVVAGGSLNGLDPNTLLLDDATITKITEAVTAALGTLSTKVVSVVTDLINNLSVHIALDASVTALLINANVDITVDAKLGQLTGAIPGAPVVAVEGDLLGIDLGPVLTLVTTPVIDLLTNTLAPVLNTVVNGITSGLPGTLNGIINPVLEGLSPVLDALNEVVEITINEQSNPGQTGTTDPTQGNLNRGFTVSALSLELLPSAGAVNLDLSSSSVFAQPEDVDPGDVNTNASASASASATADDDSNASAQVAAQAAAMADASSTASAAADPDAQAAASAAATAEVDADASATASTDATPDANAAAAVAAQAAAQADASDDTASEGTAVATADPNAAAAQAATADSSNEASATAAADASATATATADPTASATATADPTASATATADPTAAATATAAANAEVNTNATASASASATADDDSNASAQVAAQAAALADASTSAKAAADVTAAAAAQAAASTTADASASATTAANAAAAASAQAAAQADNSAQTNADTSAAQDANTAASASAAATSTSSAAASATAAANANASSTTSATSSATATATASANSNASADANPTGKLGITVKHPVLERGQVQTAVGTGFKPGEVVTGVMNSDPLALGTQVANAQGTVTFTWTIPAGTDLGNHTVTLTGPQSGSVAGTFKVVAKGLATTGADVPFGPIALGALLLMLGLGTALVARNRRKVTAE